MTNPTLSTQHVFIATTCIHCGHDDHDVGLPDECPVPHEADVWSFDSTHNPMADEDDALYSSEFNIDEI